MEITGHWFSEQVYCLHSYQTTQISFTQQQKTLFYEVSFILLLGDKGYISNSYLRRKRINLLLDGPDQVNFFNIQFFSQILMWRKGTFHRIFSKLPFVSMNNVYCLIEVHSLILLASPSSLDPP